MHGVCVALDRCRTPDDQEEVEKIAVKIFEKMPEDVVKQEHHKTLKANGLCRVRCIRKLTEEKLQQLGVSMGDFMIILEVLHAEETPDAEKLEQQPNVELLQDTRRRGRECGRFRSADRRSIRTWMAGNRTRRDCGCVCTRI